MAVMDSCSDVTQLLLAWEDGDEHALDRLLPMVYEELQAMAHRQLRHQYGTPTLRTTALVHEAYLKMFDRERLSLESRAHFFGAIARAMRQVLIDCARRRRAQKRGGQATHFSLDDRDLAIDECATELLDLQEALLRLEVLDPRQARVVECRFFGGLSVDETALVLNTSARTVKRDWRKARAWLHRELYPA